MREILFRGKRKDNGEWVTSGNIIRFNPEDGETPIFIPGLNERCLCVHDADDNILSFEKANFYKVDPDTVGQFTGLTDKNGTKIFEGDIVLITGYEYPALIRFRHCGFEYLHRCVATQLSMLVGTDAEFEVIGNIHDNPELLRRKAGDI